MLETKIEQELHAQLETMPVSKQKEVLEFARALNLKSSIGVAGASYFPLIGLFDPDDLAEMKKAIEEGCEQIDPHGWKSNFRYKHQHRIR